MVLNKIKFSDIIDKYRNICNIGNLTVDDISGINRDKEFFSPARQISKDTTDYKIVYPGSFACNLLHVGRDGVLPVALNMTGGRKIVSPNYHVFSFIENKYILKEYFWMMLYSEEIDRYFWYNTEASITDRIDWNTFIETELTVPDLSLQKKYVEVFSYCSKLIQILEESVDKCIKFRDNFFEIMIKDSSQAELGDFIELSEEINSKGEYSEKNLYGISNDKIFTHSMTNIRKVNLSNFFIVKPGYFAYNTISSRNNERLSVALNSFDYNILVSNRYKVFKIKSSNLLEKYLYYYFMSREFDRYARYNSWGCAREEFSYEALCKFKILVPDIDIQKKIVSVAEFCELKKNKVQYYKKFRKNFCSLLYKYYLAL